MINWNEIDTLLAEHGMAVYKPFGNTETAYTAISEHYPDCDVEIDCDGHICIIESGDE